MIPLLQVALSNEPIPWAAIVAVFATLATGVVILMRGFNERRMMQLKAQIESLQAVRKTEEAVVTLAVAAAAIVPVEIFKVLYIGTQSIDQTNMTKRFRQAGIENQLITFDSVQAGFEYLVTHPTVGFVIILVNDLKRGTEFLDMVKADDTIKDIPVIFQDGNSSAAALAVYEGGGAGTVAQPLSITALMTILNKENISTTFSKTK